MAETLPRIHYLVRNYFHLPKIERLFRSHFDAVTIDEGYRPGSLDRTVWYSNHHSWWDPILPFLINSTSFNQDAWVQVPETRLVDSPHLLHLGAFTVDKSSPNTAERSLMELVEHMKRPGTAAYLLPQGDLKDSTLPLRFEKGLAWLYQALPKVDFVPVGTVIHNRHSAKPRMHLVVGHPVRTSSNDRDEISATLESALEEQLDRARENIKVPDLPPTRLI